MNRDQGSLDTGELEPPDPRELIEPDVAWAGLPAFHPTGPRETRLVLAFDTEAERDELVAQLGIFIAKKTKGTWSAWWPPREQEDLSSLRFDFGAEEQGEPDPEPTGDSAQPWPEHLGHQIALAWDDEGTVTGAHCRTCDVVLPPPDAARS